MPHAPAPKLLDIGATILMMRVIMRMSMIIPPKKKMVILGHIINVQMVMRKQPQLVLLNQTLLVYLIC